MLKKKKKCFQGFSIAVFCLVEINRREMYEVRPYNSLRAIDLRLIEWLR